MWLISHTLFLSILKNVPGRPKFKYMYMDLTFPLTQPIHKNFSTPQKKNVFIILE